MRCALFRDTVYHNTTEKTVHHHYFITASKMPELYNSYKKIKDLKILPKILNIYNRLIDILAAKAVI